MKLVNLDLDVVVPNPNQPRGEFDEEKLKELADNIKAHGLVEPIIVSPKGNKYVIIAGERRWRASKMAKTGTIQAIVKEYKNEIDAKMDTLMENEIREDLTNAEFRDFCVLMAKGLGEGYYSKEKGVNTYQLTKHILGYKSADKESVERSYIYHKMCGVFYIDKWGVSELKEGIDAGRISLDAGIKIATIKDPATQRKLAQMAAAKDRKGLKRAIEHHNLEEHYKEVTLQDRSNKRKFSPIMTEDKLVLKILSRLNEWSAHFDAIIMILEADERFLSKFQAENRKRIVTSMKPLMKKSRRFNELMEKNLLAIGGEGE